VPLDDETQAFLSAANLSPAPAPGTLALDAFREAIRGFRASTWDREEVAEVHDLAVPVPGGGEVPVRLYRPHTDAPPPALVCVHGGSWVRLNVADQDEFYRALANRTGALLAAVDYSLSPEARIPRAIEEVLAVGRHLDDHADELGVDGGRLAVLGESSGGNVVAAATHLARDRGDIRFHRQILMMPFVVARYDSPSWQEFGADFLLKAESLEWALDQYAPGVPRDDPRVSPLLAADHADLPPALVVTAEYDPLRDDAEAYAAALAAAGVPVQHWRVPGLIHHAPLVPKQLPSALAFMEGFASRVRAIVHEEPSGSRSHAA
jgi:acetyl esterase